MGGGEDIVSSVETEQGNLDKVDLLVNTRLDVVLVV